ncbi:MAG: NIPSNAP family protein [Planctomycetaceae bacterium]
MITPTQWGLFCGCLAVGTLFATAAAEDAQETPVPVYELRTYTTHPGRMDALHARFRDHTMRLFARHGMENVIYFTPTDQENTLVYLLRHKSRDAANASWKAFREDPEWQKARTESEKDAPIVKKVVSQYLTETDYSPALTGAK